MLLDFRKLLVARFLFTAAVQMQAIMLGWRMYELTHDALHLGLIGLTEAVPALGLALYAGYLVDRHHPLHIYRRVVDASALSALVFLVSQLGAVQMPADLQVIALYCASFMTGLARAFSQPAIYATVPKLVPRAMLARTSAWMASSMQIARIAGPAVGGLLFGWLDATWSSAIVLTLLLVGGAIVRTIPRFAVAPPQAANQSVVRELLAGVRFVFSHPILLPALSLDMLSVLFGGVTALLPVFAADILLVGPKGLGILRAAPAVGAAITSLLMMRANFGRHAGALLLWSVAGFGFCILAFGCSRGVVLSAVALGLSGAFDSVSMVIRGAVVQLESPEALRGRVSAVNAIFIGSSNELGEFESGVAAKLFGAVAATLGGGLVCLLVVAGIAAKSGPLRKLRLEGMT